MFQPDAIQFGISQLGGPRRKRTNASRREARWSFLRLDGVGTSSVKFCRSGKLQFRSEFSEDAIVKVQRRVVADWEDVFVGVGKGCGGLVKVTGDVRIVAQSSGYGFAELSED